MNGESGAVFEVESGTRRKVYSDFVPFCDATVPNALRSFEGETLEISAEVKERKVLQVGADALFEFPQGAEVWPWCPNPEPPKVDSTVKPVYPIAMASGGKQGRVVVGLIVDETGQVKAVGVKKSGGKEFDTAAQESVRKWKFKPARCGETAVPAEHVVTINFAMK